MKILILYTGGTFGSSEGTVRRLSAPEFSVVDKYRKENPSALMEFEERSLDTLISSENMTIFLWNSLIDALRKVDFALYDGVIITHGTDTLAYTSALLSVVLGHVKIPVVLVSSNAPLSSPNANGYDNFRDGVDFIGTCGDYSGVFVTYHQNGESHVLLGEKISQSRPFIHSFEHFDGSRFGTMKDGRFFPLSDYKSAVREDILDTLPPLTNSVLSVTPYVGLDYSRINFDGGQPVRAVLHGTYHSYTMCVDQKPQDNPSSYSAEYFLNECNRRNIALYFASREEGAEYESGEKLRQLGAKFISNTSFELGYAQLLAKYGSKT